MEADVIAYLPTYRSVHGWFSFTDLLVLDALLDAQSVSGTRGDLLEIGVMHGRSALFLGSKAHSDESISLCDLFGAPAGSPLNEQENVASYPGLSRETFEHRWLDLGLPVPTVFQMNSEDLPDHLEPASFRFIPVDGSHLFSIVSRDVALAERCLLPSDGWVAFDDFRATHTPGVAAAVWPALMRGPLRPVLVTRTKLNAAREPSQSTIDLLSATISDYGFDLELVPLDEGQYVLRVVEAVELEPYLGPTTWRGQEIITPHPRSEPGIAI